MDNVNLTYDKGELRGILKAFKAMNDEAVDEAKKVSAELAEYLKQKIIAAARLHPTSPKAALRIAEGARVSKSSKIGDLSFGFASQKYSGGATTQKNEGNAGGIGVLAGYEFGSKKYRQFPRRSAPYGFGGSEGYFIYPTLRENQPELIKRWEESFNRILKEWDK